MDQEKVQFGCRYVVNSITECWIWLGKGRYGTCNNEPAHRASWKFHNGSIPDGLHVGHRCNNKRCVNPAHLYLCTNQQNMLDAARDGLLRGQKQPMTPQMLDEIWDLRLSGMKQSEIAAAYNVAQISVSRIWRRRGYKRGREWQHFYPQNRPSGEAHPFSKITDLQRDEIWDLRLSGMTQHEIGAAYGVTEGAVSHLWKRRGHRIRKFVPRKRRL